MLPKTYKKIRKSIVAFAVRNPSFHGKKYGANYYPQIIGTGFIVNESGLVATNAHVAEAIDNVPRHPDIPDDEYPVSVLLFCDVSGGLTQLECKICGRFVISGYASPHPYYGMERGPDIAYIQLNVIGLPAVKIAKNFLIEEGLDVSTAGFPMGTQALMAPGFLYQLSPTLQSGIISSLLPFNSPKPHAFSINVMVQGGASGSPVFLSSSGVVIGILNSSLNEMRTTEINKTEKLNYSVPTNISYVDSFHHLNKTLDIVLKAKHLEPPEDAPTLHYLIEHGTPIDETRFQKEKRD